MTTTDLTPDLSARGLRIEGIAIVSRDGMLAAADGVMPDSMMFPGDQRFFIDTLNRMAVVVHGRNSEESHPNSARRRRIIVTRQCDGVAPSPLNPLAMLWNPQAVPLRAALERAGIDDGAIGIIGGTDVFSLFLPVYDVFHLSRAPGVTLPGGRPVFAGIPQQTPEAILTRSGLTLGSVRVIDAAGNVTLEEWRR